MQLRPKLPFLRETNILLFIHFSYSFKRKHTLKQSSMSSTKGTGRQCIIVLFKLQNTCNHYTMKTCTTFSSTFVVPKNTFTMLVSFIFNALATFLPYFFLVYINCNIVARFWNHLQHFDASCSIWEPLATMWLHLFHLEPHCKIWRLTLTIFCLSMMIWPLHNIKMISINLWWWPLSL